MRSAAKHASSAYLSSLLSCKSLVEQVAPSLDLHLDSDQALEHLNSVLDLEEGNITEEVAFGMNQKQLSTLIYGTVYRSLLGLADDVREKARLHSVGLPHAGDFLLVVTSPSLGLQLRPTEFRISVLYRLGMPVFQSEGACIACDQYSDRYGDHAVGCVSQGERIARHNHLRDAIYHTAQSAQLGPLREERALLPGSERPADVLLPHHAGGLHEALDVCVVSSLQGQLVERASEEPGHALVHRYQQKWRKYGEACLREGIAFQPVPFEVLGGLHKASVIVIKKLGQALARATGQDGKEVSRHLFGRLGVLLQRGNQV